MKRMMLTTAKFLPLLVLALPLAWAGCGGDDDDADEGPEQDNRAMSALTDGELMAVCDDLRQGARAETQLSAFAHLNCLAMEPMLGACDDARLDQCVDARLQEPEGTRTPCFPIEFQAEDCDATVAEYAACYNDTIGAMDRLTCSSLEQGITLPASCEEIRADCPSGLILDIEPAEE